MKAKEEAKQLVNRFLQIYDGRVPQAKKCALICIDEMIGNYEEKYKYCKSKQFLEKVKKEINKL